MQIFGFGFVTAWGREGCSFCSTIQSRRNTICRESARCIFHTPLRRLQRLGLFETSCEQLMIKFQFRMNARKRSENKPFLQTLLQLSFIKAYVFKGHWSEHDLKHFPVILLAVGWSTVIVLELNSKQSCQKIVPLIISAQLTHSLWSKYLRLRKHCPKQS